MKFMYMRIGNQILLRKLESASLAFEKNDDGMEEKWLKQLVAPGSSLGGARPKATVVAPDGSLWIAKFPSKHDEINVGAWEMVVHDLAVMCNLNVPEAKLENFSKTGSTFLTKRFDREGDRRIHFASAMTLLGKTDGMNASVGSSYMEIGSIIKANSATPGKDLLELWRKIVFNLALSVAQMYRLTETQALEELKKIKNVVESNWRRLAGQYGLSRSEIEGIAPEFDMSFKG